MGLLDRLHAGCGAIVFLKDVIADRVDEGTQAVGLAKTTLGAQGPQNADKGFLAEIFDNFGRQAARPQLNP